MQQCGELHQCQGKFHQENHDYIAHIFVWYPIFKQIHMHNSLTAASHVWHHGVPQGKCPLQVALETSSMGTTSRKKESITTAGQSSTARRRRNTSSTMERGTGLGKLGNSGEGQNRTGLAVSCLKTSDIHRTHMPVSSSQKLGSLRGSDKFVDPLYKPIHAVHAPSMVTYGFHALPMRGASGSCTGARVQKVLVASRPCARLICPERARLGQFTSRRAARAAWPLHPARYYQIIRSCI